MFGRPRCREWTPLATQQLRLRSLIQIVGYNIRPPERCGRACSFYLTLHHTSMSAPFHTTERLASPHPRWNEIDAEITQRMSATNVVIRIWCHVINDNDEDTQDSVIETWGVYFSGLRYIGANLASNFNSDCFKTNTLVFQMHGGYFCSYKSLKLDIIPPENEYDHGSLSSDSSGRTSLSRNLEKFKESRSLSPNKYVRRVDKEYSKSHSPIERHFPTIRTSASLNIKNNEAKNDPSNIYEHSPENTNVKEVADLNCDSLSKNTSQEDLFDSKIDLSETAESYDLRNESDGVPKYRYLALNFLKSEIRPSYTASKLQKLHLLQYSIKKKQEAVQEIKAKIYKLSALNESVSLEQDFTKLKRKSRVQKDLFSMESSEEERMKCESRGEMNGRVKERVTSNGPRLGLKLNDLLSFKTKPSPFQRSEHIRLTKQLEILRFKRIILADERDSKLASIRRLKERHAKLAEENQDVGTDLMQKYHSLSRRSESVRECRQACGALRDLAAASHADLSARRAHLLTQLHHIFYIQQIDSTTWSICGVPLGVCGDESPRGAGVGAGEAAAAGLAAQAACVAAALLHLPLRYRVTLLGSASKITDITPDLPDPNIPLYPRGGDVTLFRYGMFLLNKCIAQLCAGRGLPLADIRPTLHNLQRLLTTHGHRSDTCRVYGLHRWGWGCEAVCARTQSLRSLADRAHYRHFNRFKDGVDGHSPQPAPDVRRHRHSRSVGSYRDDQELAALNTSTASIMGSESNIYNMKLNANDSDDIIKHNSDTNIHSIDNKVLFTLGDEAGIELEQHTIDLEPNIDIEQAIDEDQTLDKSVLNSSDTTLGLGSSDTTICLESSLIESESKLVRLSSNNDDGCTCLDDVRRICTEINDFCSKDVPQGFDVAKYMETKRASEIQEVGNCLSCEGEGDSECQLDCVKNVTDVIVIPSAEAVLDTGQTDGI